MVLLIVLLFVIALIWGLTDPTPSSPRGVSKAQYLQGEGLIDEHGHLTVRGMAFYDGLDGSFDGAPPDVHADWF